MPFFTRLSQNTCGLSCGRAVHTRVPSASRKKSVQSAGVMDSPPYNLRSVLRCCMIVDDIVHHQACRPPLQNYHRITDTDHLLCISNYMDSTASHFLSLVVLMLGQYRAHHTRGISWLHLNYDDPTLCASTSFYQFRYILYRWSSAHALFLALAGRTWRWNVHERSNRESYLFVTFDDLQKFI